MENSVEDQLSALSTGNITTANPARLPLDLYRAVPVAILLAVIDVVTVFGNILVIIAVLTTRSLRNVTCNYYIVSLAVSDLLLGVLVLPFSSVYAILNYWSFPSFFCVVWLTTDVLSCTASILNLLCISVDRYLAISRPLHYHNYSSPRFVFIMIAAAWILAFLISVAPVFGFDGSAGEADQCTVAASGLFWTLYSSVGSFFLPLCVMLFLYFRIYLVAAKHSQFMKEERQRYASFAQQQQEFDNNVAAGNRNLSLDQGSDAVGVGNHRISRVTIVSNGTPQAGDYHGFPKDSLAQVHGKKPGLMKKLRRLSKDYKAAKTLFIVMACFILCWLPFFTIYLIDGVCKEVCNISKRLFDVFFWLGYCNSMLNPVIYTVSSHDFRTAFRKILHCPTIPISDPFGGGGADSAARPTGNGRPSSSGKASNSQRHTSPASRLITTTRTELDTPLHRSPATAAEAVAGHYTLVEQQQSSENGLLPMTAGAGLQFDREIGNVPLPHDGCDLSLDRTSGPDDGSLKENSLAKDIIRTDYGTMAPSGASPRHSQNISLAASATLTQERLKNGTPFGTTGWQKVKVKARQMVAVLSPDSKKTRLPERSLAGEHLVMESPRYQPEMADAGVTTNEPDISEKCVQTSISFVDLGDI